MKTCKDCAFYTFCKQRHKSIGIISVAKHCRDFYARDEAEKEYVLKLVEKIAKVLTKQ